MASAVYVLQDFVILSVVDDERSETSTESKDPFDRMQEWTLQGVLSTVVKETPCEARQLVESKGILRLRGCFAQREAFTPLRTTTRKWNTRISKSIQTANGELHVE